MSRRLTAVLALALSLTCAGVVSADIIIPPYTFDDQAFADDATQLEQGTLSLFGATDLDDALTGYSPGKCIVNIGYQGNANLFQLDFTDLMAVNGPGADIVMFEGYNPPMHSEPYDIAVRVAGSGFTAFETFAASEYLPLPSADGYATHALPLDLDRYALAAGTVVDAVMFRSLANLMGHPEGDPIMAAVLQGGQDVIPEPATITLVGIGLVAALRRRRTR